MFKHFIKYNRNYDSFSVEKILVEIFNCTDFRELAEQIPKGKKDMSSMAVSEIYWEMAFLCTSVKLSLMFIL